MRSRGAMAAPSNLKIRLAVTSARTLIADTQRLRLQGRNDGSHATAPATTGSEAVTAGWPVREGVATGNPAAPSVSPSVTDGS